METTMPVDEDVQQPATPPADALEELPVLTVRDTVVFPHGMLPITVGRPSSVALVQAMGENRMVCIIAQLDPRTDAPGPEDLSRIGTVAILHKVLRMPTDNLLLFCEGVDRVEVEEYTATEPFLRAKVRRLPAVEVESTAEIEALRQNVLSAYAQIVAATPNLSDDLIPQAQQPQDPGRLADFIAGTLPSLSHPERQSLLE